MRSARESARSKSRWRPLPSTVTLALTSEPGIRAPAAGPVPLRFSIESMVIQPVEQVTEAAEDEPEPMAGFAEDQAPFQPAERRGLRTIEGGGRKRDHGDGKAPKLKIVRDDD